MERQDIQRLRDLPIEGVAEGVGLEVSQHKALCPFHDDHHASLSFNVRKNTFRCFVCGEHGGTIDLVMKCLHKDFIEACRWLGGESVSSFMVQGSRVDSLHLNSFQRCSQPSAQGSREQGSREQGSREQGSRFKVQGSREQGSRDQGSRFKVQGSRDQGSREQGSRFKVQGSRDQGSRDQGSREQEKTFDAQRYEKFFERPWLSEEARRFLFEERRLDERVVRWCRLTSWRDRQGVNWLQIPYYDREGQLVGIQNRNLDWFKVQGVQEVQGSRVQGSRVQGSRVQGSRVQGVQEVQEVQGVQGSREVPRFRFPQGSSCGIYNLPVLNRLHEGEPLYITEGASDCWAALSAGHKAIAIPSATLLKPRDVRMLERLNGELGTPFHMFPDRDEPGERLFLQLQRLLPNLEHHQLPVGCKDYSDYYVKFKG